MKGNTVRWIVMSVMIFLLTGGITYVTYLRSLERPICVPSPMCTPDPDGTWIAFSSSRHSWRSRTGRHPYYIYVMNADGTCATRLDDTPDAVWARWSPDGTRLLFEANGTLYVIGSDGSGKKPLATYGECSARPLWSPDGSRIAFLASSERERQTPPEIGGVGLPGSSEDCRLCTVHADGSQETILVDIPLIIGRGRSLASSFSWSSDGAKIAFSAADPDTGQHEVYTVDADGSDLVNLTKHPDEDNFVTWSPDGRIFFLSDRDITDKSRYRRNLYVMNADGANVRRLVDNVDHQPRSGAWVPFSDSKIILSVVYSRWSDTSGWYVVDVDCTLEEATSPGFVPPACYTRLPPPPRADI